MRRFAPNFAMRTRALSCEATNKATGQRQEGEAGGERAVAEHVLQELGQEEEHPEHAAHEHEAGQVREGAVAVGEQPQRRDRRRRTGFDEREGRQQHQTDDERQDRALVTPSVGRRPHEAIDKRGHADGRRQGPGEVDAPHVPISLGQVATGQDEQDDADRDVHEEHPAPRRPLDEHSAGDQTDGAAADRHRGVESDRAGALGTLAEHHHEQGQRGRRRERGADALHGASGKEQARRRGEAAGQRTDREERDAGDEDPPATEQVTAARAQQQEAAERQRVGVEHPGQVGAAERQRGLDVGKGDVHDRGVKHDHQLSDQDDGQCAGATGRGLDRGADFGGCVDWHSRPPGGMMYEVEGASSNNTEAASV